MRSWANGYPGGVVRGEYATRAEADEHAQPGRCYIIERGDTWETSTPLPDDPEVLEALELTRDDLSRMVAASTPLPQKGTLAEMEAEYLERLKETAHQPGTELHEALRQLGLEGGNQQRELNCYRNAQGAVLDAGFTSGTEPSEAIYKLANLRDELRERLERSADELFAARKAFRGTSDNALAEQIAALVHDAMAAYTVGCVRGDFTHDAIVAIEQEAATSIVELPLLRQMVAEHTAIEVRRQIAMDEGGDADAILVCNQIDKLAKAFTLGWRLQDEDAAGIERASISAEEFVARLRATGTEADKE